VRGIRESVASAAGAGIPGIDISVSDILTSVSRTTGADKAGNFGISNLKPGTYRLQASLPGFKSTLVQLDKSALESRKTGLSPIGSGFQIRNPEVARFICACGSRNASENITDTDINPRYPCARGARHTFPNPTH